MAHGPGLTPEKAEGLRLGIDAVVQQFGCRPGISIFHPLMSEIGLQGFTLVETENLRVLQIKAAGYDQIAAVALKTLEETDDA